MNYKRNMSTQFDQISHLIRPHFLKMQGYQSAGMLAGKDESRIFLNANENPYPLPGLEGYNRYPEPQPPKLLAGLAGLYGVAPENITITRGADEAIKLMTQLCIEPFQDDLLICPPAFGVYKVDGDIMPSRKTVAVPLIKSGGTFRLDVAGIKAALDDPQNRIRLVFLTSPNNPTGGNLAYDDLKAVIEAARGRSLVVMDETYAEFTDQASFTAKIADYPHLVILRTLSKSYALAGMRVGCAISGVPEFTQILRTKIMETYPIPRGSVEAALTVLLPENITRAHENIRRQVAERRRMEAFLKTCAGVTHVYPSDANFLLVEMERAREFHAFALSRGIILRDFSAAQGTQDCIRQSIGTAEQNDMVMDLYREFFATAPA